MSKKEAKLIYECMLENGELYMMMPGATGEWEKDRDTFMSLYDVNIETIEDSLNDDLYNDDFE